MNQFVITEVACCFYAVDSKGHKIQITDREYACFIIPIQGTIRFTFCDQTLICDRTHPVFLPFGATYTNECLDDAESYVFQFLTQENSLPPMVLSEPYTQQVRQCYDVLSKGSSNSYPSSTQMMGLLYLLASALFTQPPISAAESVLQAACEFIASHYSSPALTVQKVSEHCFVSESYLRKLFLNHLGKPPFGYITDIRMKNAYLLVLEKRPIHEIAGAVGYCDVYQFSRAYKRYFGISPSLHINAKRRP